MAGGANALISDQAHNNGTPGFFFLPPLVQAASNGANKRGLSPVVKIEELAPGTRGIIATFTTTSGTFGATIKDDGASHYQVNWDTRRYGLDPQLTYRIHVWLEDFELGFADVDVVQSGREIKNVQTSEHVPLLDGRTLPIKFRIQQEALKCVGVVCAAQDRCHVGACSPTTGVCSQAPAATCPVFVDDYAPGVLFTPFGGSTNDVTRDPTTLNNGRASLKVVTVGGGGAYTGGALVAAAPLDLRAYNALSFWAKASPTVNWDHMGFGDTAGATGPGLEVELHGTAIEGGFQKYYFPIPTPAALASARGLFFFADGANPGTTAWFNDVQYETLDPATFESMFGTVYWVYGVLSSSPSLGIALGEASQLDFNPNTVLYTSGTTLYRVGWNYFTLSSDDTAVATVDADGLITGQGAGNANITAKLGAFDVAGRLAVAVGGPLDVPTMPAPTPTHPNVLSMYNSSGTYTDAQGIDWGAAWSNNGAGANLSDFTIPGTTSVVKKYALMNYVGVEFYGPSAIDASTYSHLHVDVWTPNATKLGVQLVDLGAGTTPAEVQYYAPTIYTGSWIGLDIPLTDFTAVNPSMVFTSLQQLLFTDNFGPGGVEGATFYVDNVYFWKP